MDKVKINWRCPGITGWPPSATYTHYQPQFSWASRPYNGVATQLTSWHGCRETFTSELRRCHSPVVNKAWRSKLKIDSRRARILVLFKQPNMKNDLAIHKAAEIQMEEAVRVLNIIERYKKWPMSKVSRVDGLSDNESCFLLTGSGKWIISPQMVSFYLLIVRLCAQDKHTAAFKKFSTKDFAAISRSANYSRAGDFGYFRSCYTKLQLFFDNYDELFGETTIKDNFAAWAGSSGINNLMSMASRPMNQHLVNLYHPAVWKFNVILEASKKKKA